MASGGGCEDHISNGWNIGVCSSDNGTRVYGDIYVNTRGSLGSVCRIEFYIKDSADSTKASRIDGCYLGHHSPISATMNSGCYRTESLVFVNGAIKGGGISPQSCK
jgi:hypothetical protein